ncbi:MAG: hypothetical protein ACO26G_06435 [Rickettsiales bacterium]
MIHFDSSRLSPKDAKLYFSNTLIQRDGKFYMTFPKFDLENSGKNDLPPIVELPVNPANSFKLDQLNSLINPEDEENYRIVFAIEDDKRSVNGNLYSLYAVKIPKEKIKQSIKLEDLDDHREFIKKVEFQSTYGSQRIERPIYSSAPPSFFCQSNLSVSSLNHSQTQSSLNSLNHATFCDLIGEMLSPSPVMAALKKGEASKMQLNSGSIRFNC